MTQKLWQRPAVPGRPVAQSGHGENANTRGRQPSEALQRAVGRLHMLQGIKAQNTIEKPGAKHVWGLTHIGHNGVSHGPSQHRTSLRRSASVDIHAENEATRSCGESASALAMGAAPDVDNQSG